MTTDQMVREDLRVMFEDEQIELLPARTTMGHKGGKNYMPGNGGGNTYNTAIAIAQVNQFGLVNVNTGDVTAVAVAGNG